jgi:hypothetical protein
MAPTKSCVALLVAFLVPALFVIATDQSLSDPQSVEIACRIVHVEAQLDNDSLRIPIWLANYMPDDSVGGFELWINCSHPNFIAFDTDTSWWLHDSHCIEYAGEDCIEWGYDSIEIAATRYDSNNTITQGWEFLEARVLGGDGGVIKVSGAANLPAPPLTPGFATGFDTLIHIFAHTVGVLGDSLCDSVDIELRINQSQTRFSDTQDELFGCNYEWLVDTFYFNCAQWDGDSCVAWFDTVLDSVNACVIDTSKIVLVNDTIDLLCCDCDWDPGDCDYNGNINVSDVVWLIQYVFAEGNPPVPVPEAGDATCDGTINVSDIVALIQFVFADGEPPPCTCEDLVC